MRKADFELAFDPAAAMRHLRKDPRLSPLLRRVGAFKLELRPSPTPFEALTHAIIHQQLNGKVAASIFSRFQGLFVKSVRPDALLALPETALRTAGLSQAKAIAVRDLAQKAEEGLIPGWAALRRMEDEDIIAQLTQIKGVGRWTVEMLLIFRLGRPDVWPVSDFAVRKAYGLWFEQLGLADMVSRAEPWRPYRTVVAWYLWRSLEV